MIQAGHHNNKANKVVSGTHKAPSSQLFSLRRPRVVQYSGRHRRFVALKLAKPTPSPLAPAQTNGVAAATPAARAPCAKLELPACLERPALKEINIQNLYKACPDLKDTPPSYVRENLQLLAPSMLVGLQSANILVSKSQLPQELQVVISDSLTMAGISPTHILALCSSRPSKNTSGSPERFTLFPIHSMVFAANCSSFPLLPFSAASTPEGNTTGTLSLPVVRHAIPSPESFPVLSTYLYTKSTPTLRHALLPPNWAPDVQSIVRKALFIHGLWANARVFGVVDAAFWVVIEDCWADVIRSLSQVTACAPSS